MQEQTMPVQSVEIFNLAIHQDAVYGEAKIGIVG